MRRREALHYTATILGGSISSSIVFGALSGCSAKTSLEWKPLILTPEETMVVSDLMECIFPETDTPGAKAAGVERFVDSMLAEFLMQSEKEVFLNGVRKLVQLDFSSRSDSEQQQMVEHLVDEARAQTQEDISSKPFFKLARELAIVGFFTSEVGVTQVLQYDPIPGGFQGCKPIGEVGPKSWAT